MSRQTPASLLRSGQQVFVDVGGGLRLAHVINVRHDDNDHVAVQLVCHIPDTAPVYVEGDPFQGLVDELEAWGGA